jgi:TetR/AcrR family transcriptional repressor of nem operon
MGHTPTTARGRATRERILDAAADLIQQRGVAAVTLDDVERAAGVGRSQLYHYFDDRDDLVRSVVHSTVDKVLAAQEPLLLEVGSLDGIDRWFGAIVANGTRQDAVGGCAIGSLAAQLSDRDDLTREAFVDAFARWEAPLIAGLRRMQESGELLPDVDVTDLADLTMAAIQGGLLLAQIRRKPDQLRLALRGARAALEDALTQTVHSGQPAAGKRPRDAGAG